MSTPPPVSDRAKTQLAQLLADTLIAHAPHTSEIGSATTRRHVNEWLEELESHTQQFVAPFLQNVLDHSDPPEPVRALLAEAISPSAALSATIEQIFLFGIVSNVISVATSPFLLGLAGDLSATAVSTGSARPIDPSILATAAGRGFDPKGPYSLTPDANILAEAARSGIDAENMSLMASLVGLPPALQELFEMVRRGIITASGVGAPAVQTNQTPATDTQGKPLTVEQGLKEGDFRDDWIGAAVGLLHAYLTPLDFVRAAVQEQMSYADARDWANATGLDLKATVPVNVIPGVTTPDMFGLAYSIAGRPPGPQELAVMAARQIIAWTGTGAATTSFQQGIAESDVKTKWTDALQALATYIPAPEQTATLLERGAITPAQAATYWADHNVPPDVVTALTFVAEHEAHLQERLLAKGDILKAYYDGIFTQAQALPLLADLGYTGTVAMEMLEIQDFRRQIRAIDQTVRKVGTAYEAFKLSATDVLATLQQLGLSSTESNALLGTWDQLRIRPLRVPTTSEIGAAVKYGTLTEAEALTELADLGYQARDAAIVLSAHAEAPVTPLPPAGTTTTG